MLFKNVVGISQSLKQRFPGTDPCCANVDPQGPKYAEYGMGCA